MRRSAASVASARNIRATWSDAEAGNARAKSGSTTVLDDGTMTPIRRVAVDRSVDIRVLRAAQGGRPGVFDVVEHVLRRVQIEQIGWIALNHGHHVLLGDPFLENRLTENPQRF